MHSREGRCCRRSIWASCLLVVCLAPVVVLAQDQFEPARLTSGSPPPPPPPTVVASGQVWLRASIDATGNVRAVSDLQAAPTFGAALQQAVRGWAFTPAKAEGVAVSSAVLVAALVRPAALYVPPGLGRPPRDPARAPTDVPVPVETPVPSYPVTAVGSGVVVVEVEVGPTGSVATARVIRASPGFDRTAADVARHWRFRPPTRLGRPVPSLAYLVFSFREPVVAAPVRR